MTPLLAMVRDLVAHKGHANASFLGAVRQNERAAADIEILEALHHILVANRFWISTIRRVPFLFDQEMGAPRSCDALVEAFKKTQEEETAWLTAATEADCAAILEHSLIPGGQCSVAQGFMQVCLHSQGHRAQLAKLLRRHEVVPAQTDFILWLAHPAEPEWQLGGRSNDRL
jgi:uncharacterized damage-inducible protein DinB